MARKDISDEQVVRAYASYRSLDVSVWELLMEETGQPFKVCLRAAERALDRGLLEYGTSLNSAWVTDKACLKFNVSRIKQNRAELLDAIKGAANLLRNRYEVAA